jgi:chromosomal replication initiation ATPase DnaA
MTERPRQLPLDLGHVAASSRDDLVVSPANRDALALIERWPGWPSPVVILAGPPGSGKSHLAAIWREQAGASAFAAEDISAGAAAAGQEAHTEDQAELAPAEAVVEDADRAGLDQTGLFHLINTVRGSGGHLLLTARSFPAAWPVTLADLASRLKAATTVEIHEPDDLLLSGVITKLFADRQVDIEPAIVQFLARRIERSLSAANEVVRRLDALAMERKSRITRALAGEVVAAIEAGATER